MYLAKIPVIDIMKISGHKAEKEFLKYIKVSKLETAQKHEKISWNTANWILMRWLKYLRNYILFYYEYV